VDTRTKIVAAPRPQNGVRRVLITGYFDVLTATYVRELTQIRAGADTLVAAVLPLSGELLPQRARAELAAALRMIDYVIITDNEYLERLIAELQPTVVVRLEAADERRRRELIDHVHRRQNS
jgi:bifunctional ADP-heptose synthase (sugar kinase/adenylyltransferase)